MSEPTMPELFRRSISREKVTEYTKFHTDDVESRTANYARMVNHYYDLVTDFYEYGWGQSFHFAPRHKGESFESSIARHEFFLAAQLGLKKGARVVDLGCGVGGPMRAIARFSGANVIGVNNNAYQITRGEKHTRAAGLEGQCRFEKADFMALPFESGSLDAAYAIEATCHAPSKVALFREILRVLKPGAHFAGYEWCLTDRYDATNERHRTIKKDIEVGDGLPDIWGTDAVVGGLLEAGFELVEARDLAVSSGSEIPWYEPIAGGWSLTGVRRTPVGRWLTHRMVQVLEWTRMAPKGTTEVSDFLNVAADALVLGGQTGIFTPMFFFHVKKPG
jgi:sterol 24-C-methyltransferase